MKRMKTELSYLVVFAIVLSMLNAFSYSVHANEQLPDLIGTGVFRVDIQVAANDCGNSSRGTNSSFRLDLLDASGTIIASSPTLIGTPGETTGNADPLESNQTTSYTFDGENTGANVHLTVPGLEEMMVNKTVAQMRFIEVEHSDEFTHKSIVVYYLLDGDYVEVGRHEYSGVAVQFNAVGDNVLFSTNWFAANVKTLNFDADGGQPDSEYNAIPGQTIEHPEVPGKQGYDFNGWMPEIPARMPNNNMTYVAQWMQTFFTISFDANGGEGGENQHLQRGVVPIPPEVTREGFIFIGWFPAVEPVTQDATYMAWWKTESQSLIVFDAAGGTGGTMVVLDKGSDLSPPQVHRDGYTFDGWSPNVPNTVPEDDMVYVAQWVANTYSIAYFGNGSSYGAMSNSQHTCGVSSPLNKNTFERTGYTFLGWAEDPQSEIAEYVDEAEVLFLTAMDGETVNLYAIWQLNAYTITFDANGGTGGTSETMNYGEELTPPQVQRQWYSFYGWEPEVPGTVPDADSVYTAQWYNGISVDIALEVGRYDSVSGDFVPLQPQEPLKPGEIVTVRICPENDFYAGATRYVVMFDKAGFEIVGLNKEAFTPNYENEFYAAVAPDYSGTTDIPDSAWPSTFDESENFEKYTAVAVGNRANSTSANGGYPDFLPGEWLFSFDLRVNDDIESGTRAKIWMDERWIRNPSNPSGASYFSKCLPGQFSSQGDSISYPYEVDLSAAVLDIELRDDFFVTVSYDLNGGVGTVPPAQYVLSTFSVELPQQGDIEKEHYSFVGWAESIDAQEPLAEFFAPDTDVILYAVWHRVPVTLAQRPSATTVINMDTGMVYGLSPGISFAQFIDSYALVTGDGELRAVEPSGAFGTGTKLELFDRVTNEVIAIYTIVIFGDVTGDGQFDGNDAGMIIDYENWMVNWDPVADAPFLMAGDLNGDGNVDIVDADILLDVENWLLTIDQTTGLAT